MSGASGHGPIQARINPSGRAAIRSFLYLDYGEALTL
jgi:hypothetical protein